MFLNVFFFLNHCTSKLLHYLKKVDFTNEYGEETKFDANGDPVAIYDLINVQLSETGEVQYATVGTFDETKSNKLLIEENLIIWNGNQRQVSLCVLKAKLKLWHHTLTFYIIPCILFFWLNC